MMFVDTLRSSATEAKKFSSKADPTTMGIIFMACVCAVLPLDISQLSFAIIGAVLYAMMTKYDSKSKQSTSRVATDAAPYNDTTPTWSQPRNLAPPQRASGRGPARSVSQAVTPEPAVAPDVRAPSVQPIVAPTFQSDSWDGEIQELLLQITPSAEAHRIVQELTQIIRSTMQTMLPEIEVTGFANGNLTFGKAFGVAVPEVDIVASISPQALYNRLHGRSSQGPPAELDEKKLQKSAIRTCTDRLVAAGGFKFRRSAFRGSEPKVTLLAPASLGLFADSIPIDFSVNVVTPMYNAALLMECGKMDSRSKDLILLVRRWAKDRGICHAAKGHLSPYMWGILTIYFLQVGDSEESPLLPALDQFECSSELPIRKRSSKQEKWTPSQTEPKKSAAVLFKEFLHFYYAEFDWRGEAVSITSAERAPPGLECPLHIIAASDADGQTQIGPSIEDPFNKDQNLGDVMTAFSMERLKEELLRAETLCLRSASLSEFLEPWVPSMAAEEEPAVEGELQASQINNSLSKLQHTVSKVADKKPSKEAPVQQSFNLRATLAAPAQAAPWRGNAKPLAAKPAGKKSSVKPFQVGSCPW